MIKSSDEIAKMNRQTLDTLSAAYAKLAEGWEEMGHHVLGAAHNSLAAHLAAGREVGGIRTLQDWFNLQTKWATQLMSAAANDGAKLTEIAARVAGNAAEPIRDHFGQTLGKLDRVI